MTPQNIRPEFAALLSRHGELIVVFRSALRNEPADVEWTDALRVEERQLRARIVTWVPINGTEALKKLEHMARFVAATGIGLDRATPDHIIHSTAFFLVS